MNDGGLPFVFGERHAWFRAIAESKLRDPVVFWKKMDANPTAKGEIPESAIEAIEHMLPEPGMRYRLARRRAGLGSLGRTRLVAIAEWKGGRVAREAKALLPSALQCVNPKRVPAEILYGAILRRAVRCPDPLCADAGALDRAAAVAALFAHRTRRARNSRGEVPPARGDGKRDGEYPCGHRGKAPGNPEGLARTKRELAGGSGASDGGRDGERLASVEGALAELDSASALLEGKSVRGLSGQVEKLEPQCLGFVFSSDGDEGVENAFEGRGRTRPDAGKGLAMNR